MAKKSSVHKDAETFVRRVLSKHLKQKVSEAKVRSIAKKVSKAIPQDRDQAAA